MKLMVVFEFIVVAVKAKCSRLGLHGLSQQRAIWSAGHSLSCVGMENCNSIEYFDHGTRTVSLPRYQHWTEGRAVPLV